MELWTGQLSNDWKFRFSAQAARSAAGILEMPLVLRVSVGSKYGAQHSQDWTAIVNHIPGLKVVFPNTPYDAKGLPNRQIPESLAGLCLAALFM